VSLWLLFLIKDTTENSEVAQRGNQLTDFGAKPVEVKAEGVNNSSGF
jgi:hypothetical protein